MAKSRARTVTISFAAGMVIGLGVLLALEMVSVKGGPSQVSAQMTAEEPNIPANPITTPVNPVSSDKDKTEVDPFAEASNHKEPTIAIRLSIDGGQWRTTKAVYPLKDQKISLKVDQASGSSIRWFRICPDTSKIYKNANLPWDENPYEWIGLAKIDYRREELSEFSGKWEIEPFDSNAIRTTNKQRHCRTDMGSFWFQAEVVKDGVLYRSAGIDDSDNRGLSPKVFRVSVREREGYLGYITSFFNVPGLFGSVTYQSNNYIGVDCADVLMAAYGRFKKKPMEKNYNVAMVVNKWKQAARCEINRGQPSRKLTWSGDIKGGDLIAVRYQGARQYQHIGALYRDKDEDGVLSANDLVIHAGPHPLHVSPLANGNFDGDVVILRP